MEGTNKDFCPQPSIIKGFRPFHFVPCLSPRGQNDPYLSPLTCQSQKKGCGEAAMGAGFGVFVPVLGTGDKMPDRGQNGDKLSPGLMYQGFQGFSVCPLLWFFEGTKRHDALPRAGLWVFVPCFRYRGQIARQGTKRGQICPLIISFPQPVLLSHRYLCRKPWHLYHSCRKRCSWPAVRCMPRQEQDSFCCG